MLGVVISKICTCGHAECSFRKVVVKHMWDDFSAGTHTVLVQLKRRINLLTTAITSFLKISILALQIYKY